MVMKEKSASSVMIAELPLHVSLPHSMKMCVDVHEDWMLHQMCFIKIYSTASLYYFVFLYQTFSLLYAFLGSY